MDRSVLVFTNMYPSTEEPEAGSFVREQVEDLRELGLDVDVVAFDGRRRRTNYAAAAFLLRRQLRLGRYDVVHAHYGLSGAVARVATRGPVVTTFHGSDTGFIPWQARVSWVVARCTHPIFVSPDGARRLGLRTASVIPMGIDLDSFAPIDRSEARRELGWSADRPIVLFPSSPNRRVKRFDLFLAVFEKARERIPDLGWVALEGYERRTVPVVMSAVDALLLTSDSEGSPLTVKEAMACGTPVVARPVGNVPALLEGVDSGGLADEMSRLAELLVAAVQGPRSRNSRDLVSRFDRRATARRVAEVYEQVIGSR